MRARPTAFRARAPRPAFAKLLQNEARIAWRVPLGLILGVATPVLLLVIFGLVPQLNVPSKRIGGLTELGAYFPILITITVLVLSLISLPTHLASYREQGILRRLSTTPVPPAWMLAAQVIVTLALTTVALGIIVGVGTAALGLGAPEQPGGFALAVILCVCAALAMGLWISAFARSAGAAGAIAQLLFYPLLFFAGVWWPREAMTPLVRHISDWTPMGGAVRALQDSMHGAFPATQSLLVMVGYAAVFGFLAVRFFRWE